MHPHVDRRAPPNQTPDSCPSLCTWKVRVQVVVAGGSRTASTPSGVKANFSSADNPARASQLVARSLIVKPALARKVVPDSSVESSTVRVAAAPLRRAAPVVRRREAATPWCERTESKG